jgi:acyl-CoA synthetase (AMP-forming)/AMP-acid ligase II
MTPASTVPRHALPHVPHWDDPWKPGELSTLVQMVRRWAREQPSDLALTFLAEGEETERLTYEYLDRRARSVAARLLETHEPGDRALLLYPPSLEFVVAFFACLYAGVTAVPAYPPGSRTMDRLLAILDDCQPATVLTPSSIAPLVQAGLTAEASAAHLPVLVTDEGPDRSSEWTEPEIGPATVAFLQYTSGSTAAPKGVIVSHGNLVDNERTICRAFSHDHSLVVVNWLPLYHDMGLIGGVLQPLYVGGRSYVMSPVEFLRRPMHWLRAISLYRGISAGGPNFGFERCALKATSRDLAELDLSSWTIAYNGAEPLRAETLDRFAETFAASGFRREALYPCYGLAEATLFVTGEPALQGPVIRSFDVRALEHERRAEPVLEGTAGGRRLVSSGRAWPGQRIAIVDPETAVELPSGREGEIWISGSNNAHGYWNRPDETREMFRAELSATGEGPFVRTGDLGFVLDGELYVTGRIKDLIIVRGRNHYPHDIERTVERAHPGLRPGCGAAFAVEVDGEERVVVVQEVDRETDPNDGATILDDVRAAVVVEHDLRPYAVLLIPAGEIPKTSSGKIQRRATRELYLGGSLPVVAESVRP